MLTTQTWCTCARPQHAHAVVLTMAANNLHIIPVLYSTRRVLKVINSSCSSAFNTVTCAQNGARGRTEQQLLRTAICMRKQGGKLMIIDISLGR